VQAFTSTRGTVHTIGELCVDGDWACAHGDLSALRDVAQQLAAYIPEPMHCHLTALADACYAEPGRAGELWNRLKEHIYQSADRPEGSPTATVVNAAEPAP
jgi:hypothetical protein